MSNVVVDKQKIDILANAIADKSGEPVTMTLDEMVEAVDGIQTDVEPNLQAKTYTVNSAGTSTVTADSEYDGLSKVNVSVPSADPLIIFASREFYTESNTRKWHVRPVCDFADGVGHGWISDNVLGNYLVCNAVPSNTTVTPTTYVQTIGGADYMMESAVTVSAMPTGTAGTPTATKGTVSNHSVSVTPSVTNTTGYITGSTKTGTAVTVSASELVSGSETKTANGTYDVTNLAELVVNVPSGGSVHVATTTWTNDSTSTVSHQFTGLSGTPKAAFLRCTEQLTRSSSNTHYYIADIVWDGTSARGNYHLRSNGSYNNVPATGTAVFTVTTGTNSITFSSSVSSRSSAPGSFYNGTYELTYVY